MIRRPRVSVWRLMTWVVVAAVALAMGRYPYDLVRERQRFAARAREGKALVKSYGAQCPKGVRAASWTQAVGVVQVAWRDVVSSPGNIADADLDDILDQMRGLASRATPADAEGDLYRILDLLAHARTKADVRYLSNRRAAVRNGLFGRIQPSPRLVNYAISLAGPRAGESALAAITAGLEVKDWQVRVACCRALGQYGLGLGSPAEAHAALDGLINSLSDEDPLVREIAAESLQAMGKRAARAVDALIERVERDPDRRVRRQAGLALESVDPSYKGAIPLF
jgi:hypothetical protein